MDICTLTPTERKELQVLLATYNTVSVVLLTRIRQVHREWQDEDERQFRGEFTPRQDVIWKRLATLEQWIEILETNEIEIGELDENDSL